MLIAQRYRLDREVGRGGMGSVWLAQDTVLERPVALKRIGLLPGAEGAQLDRVSREARVSAMLNNEHVVAVYDLVTEGDTHWLVMEYLASDNLGQVIKQRGPLSPDQSAGLLVQAAKALAAAHSAGIVHRDVKPSNMLVTPEGHLKLGDFGIARTGNDPSLTQTGMVTGSPGYLSPEVAAGHSASAASDMWSFGATIFHAVTGNPPYDTSENLMGALYRIVHEEPVRTDRAGWLDPLLRATMHTVAEDRWSAAQAIAFLRRGPRGALPAPVPISTPTGRGSADHDASSTTSVLPAARDASPPRPASAPVALLAAPLATAGDTRRGDAGQGDAGQGQGQGDKGQGGQHAAPAKDPGRKRRSLAPLWAVLGVLLVAALTYGAWKLGSTGDDSSAGPDPSSSPSSQASSPSSPTSSPTEEQTPTAAEMDTFAQSYVSSASNDPSSGYGNLTPEYQTQSGGFAGYSSFWNKVSNPRVSNVSSDAEAMTVSYDFDYNFQGKGSVHERVTLNLTYEDGTYLINGDQ